MSHINSETWAIFRDDAERLLQGVECAVLALENDASDRAKIDELFRHLHTLKGSGGLLGLSALSRLSHTAEDLVDQIRDGDVVLHGGISGALLHALDLLRLIVEETTDQPKPEHDELVEPLCTLLAAFRSDGVLSKAAPMSAAAALTPEQITPYPTLKRISPQQALAASSAVRTVIESMEAAAEGLPVEAKTEVQKVAFAVQALGIESLFAAFGLFSDSVAHGSKLALTLLWRLVHRQLEAVAGGMVVFGESPCPPGRDDASVVKSFLGAIGSTLVPVLSEASSGTPIRRACEEAGGSWAVASRLCRGMGYQELDEQISELAKRIGPVGADDADLLMAIRGVVEHLVEIQEQWTEATGLSPSPADDLRLWMQRLPTTESKGASNEAPKDTPASARPVSNDKTDRKEADAASSESKPKSKFLRVELGKVEHLMSLTGEIGMAVGDVFSLPALQGIDTEEVRAKLDRVESLIRELQDTSASFGLVAMSTVFERMRRFARDLSVETGKRFELTIAGGDTEIDKLLVDALMDPLVHLLRNAADHGLESVDERKASTKSDVANIHILARRQGEHVEISVQDDGRGMDRTAILSRGIEKGLVSAAAAGDMPDRDVWSLVFKPGFSTAKVVSNLSGRGVGMDVVQSSIQALGGRVSIRSKLGRGTTVRLHLPLTLAFLDGMVVRVGRSMYVVPVSSVSRVFRVEEDDVVHVASERVNLIRVEDKMVPSLSLEAFFSSEPETPRSDVGRLVVVIRTSRGELAIPIDELVGNEQVTMKPLVGHLAKIRASAGCGLLRNGGVAIALNCEELGEHTQAYAA